MSSKILCVDDDPNILAGFQRNLRKQFAIETALSGEIGLEMLGNQGPYAVVVADMQMPGLNGIQFLMQAKVRAPDTVRFMLTGNADQATAMAAVNQGHVFQFLTKPCPPEVLAQALEIGLRQYRLITAERELLEKTLNGSIKMLTEVLSMIDPKAFGVGQTLREYARLFAQSIHAEKTWELELAAMFSQLGYVTIPPSVVQKHRAGYGLSGPEKDMLWRLPEVGANLLAHIPRLENVATIVRYQTKHYDGSGFPSDTVAGEDICAGARILKVLHDLVQLEAKGVPRFKALEQMRSRAGWYDPKVLDAAFVCFDLYLKESASAPKPVQAITLKEVKVGHVLASAVMTKEGMAIVTAGTAVTPVLVEKLQNFSNLGELKEPIYVEEAGTSTGE